MKVKSHPLFAYLLEATAARPDAVLGFSLATPPRLREFLADLDPDLSLDWSNESFQGRHALREQVLARAGLASVCSPDDVVITAGAAEANFLAFTQLVQPGDEVVIEQPGWPQPFALAEAIGARVKVLRRPEERAWRFSVDELETLVTDRTRVIFLSNPNNPTGQVLNDRELREVVGVAERVGAHVLCDEVYAGLEWDGPRAPAVAGLYDRGISTGSVSKTLGLQGVRIGWLICRDAGVVSDAVVLREDTSEIMNVLGEAIAEIALRPDRYDVALSKARVEGHRNLAMMQAYITGRAELSWQRPSAGLIGLCRLDIEMQAEAFARRLLGSPYRTFVIPGTAYGCPQHLRLGVGGGGAVNLERGLKRLSQLLDDLGSPERE